MSFRKMTCAAVVVAACIHVVCAGTQMRAYFDDRTFPPSCAAESRIHDAMSSGRKICDMPDYVPKVKYDRTGRSYWISADAFSNSVASLTLRYPNPDVESKEKMLVAKPTDTIFRRRFSSGAGPWKVTVEIVDSNGGKCVKKVTVARPEKPVRQPAPNDLLLVGHTGYGESHDLMRDILKYDLCNLLVGWHSASKMLPEKLPDDMREEWVKAVRERKMWSMSIYAGDSTNTQAKLAKVFDARYLGNNAGEYASFMYQGREQCGIPMGVDLATARDRFVNRYIAAAGFGWISNFPWVFSTCGASLPLRARRQMARSRSSPLRNPRSGRSVMPRHRAHFA